MVRRESVWALSSSDLAVAYVLGAGRARRVRRQVSAALSTKRCSEQKLRGRLGDFESSTQRPEASPDIAGGELAHALSLPSVAQSSSGALASRLRLLWPLACPDIAEPAHTSDALTWSARSCLTGICACSAAQVWHDV